MAGRTELLMRENKVISAITSIYSTIDSLVNTKEAFNHVLYALFMEGGLTQKQISVNYGIPVQTVNNAVVSLREKGFVELKENPKDRRAKNIILTEKGLDFAQKQIGAIIAIEKKAISKMGIEKFKTMIELQELFYASLKEQLPVKADR